MIFEVDFEDAIHACERNDDAAVARERAARKAGASAASDKRNVMAIGDFNDTNYVRGVARENDAVRASDFYRAVVFVKKQIFGAAQDVLVGEKMFEIGDEVLVHGRLDV